MNLVSINLDTGSVTAWRDRSKVDVVELVNFDRSFPFCRDVIEQFRADPECFKRLEGTEIVPPCA